MAASPTTAAIATRSKVLMVRPAYGGGARCPAEWLARRAGARGSVARQHAVDEAVLDGLIRFEEAVALHVVMHFLDRLAGRGRVDLVDAPAEVQDLARLDVDVGRLALEARRRLVHQDAAVGQRR